jgi:uncharacterized membrane protein YccC
VLASVALSDTRDVHPQIKRSIGEMEQEIARLPPDNSFRPIADRLVERLRIAYTLAVPANFVPDAEPDGRRPSLRERLLGPLRTNLTWRSLVTRHALRTAVTAGLALAYTMIWFTPYDHWLTIAILGTMQPFFAMTYTRAVERVAGTALGGIVAAVVGLICTTPLSIALAMFPLAVAAFAVRAVNFGLFMLALTPIFVLLFEMGEPATDEWRIALARVALTVIGGLTAVAANFVLWPSREPTRLVAGAREAIAAHGRYAEAEFARLLDQASPAEVELGRRDAGIATNVLESSVNRALIEQGDSRRDMLEAVLLIDAALRRFAGRLSVMRFDPGLSTTMTPDALRAWRDWIGGAMRSLAVGETELPPRPDTVGRDTETVETDSPRRLAGQIELMAEAMRRLVPKGQAGVSPKARVS